MVALVVLDAFVKLILGQKRNELGENVFTLVHGPKMGRSQRRNPFQIEKSKNEV
jgi:hypothetical protein